MKKGLDYFPIDVDMFQDIRIRKLIKRQGGKAVSIYTLLLCFIYKEGYYMKWDKDLPFIISEQTGFEEAYICEAVKCCISLGLFDEELYVSEKVLTSKGIQERYKEIRKTLKRVTCMKEFLLIPSEGNGKSSEGNGEGSEVDPQKEKKKKGKGQKKKGGKKDAATAAALLEGRKEDFYNTLIPFVAKYGKEMVREFFDYWTEPNKSHSRMRFELEQTWDLSRRLALWAKRDNQFNRKINGTDNQRFDSTAWTINEAAEAIKELLAENE